jgi:hypothetical protein
VIIFLIRGCDYFIEAVKNPIDLNLLNVKLKTILATLFGLFISMVVIGQNRIATLSDRKIYGEYVLPGDLIIDSPTRFNKGKPEVIYYFMAKQWPGLREGATIWIDGEKLGFLNQIKFCNTSQSLTPWHIESAKVKNIPHTKVMATTFVCQGLKHFELNGESYSFPGLSSWPASRKFLTGSFGFHVIGNLQGGHGYSVSVRHGGSIKLNGFEVQHGFSGVRISGDNDDITVESIEISNFYIHDTGNGEGQYLGATHKPPLAKLKNLKIHRGIIARTAAEALQLQHLAGGADIHHVTIFAADVRWINEFMAGQDTGIQWSVDAGENKLHHVIVDGFGSIGLMPFGSDEMRSGGVSKVSNVLFNDGRDTGMYLHKSGSFGIHWIFDSIYFRGFNSTYYQHTGRKKRNFYVSRKHGMDLVTFKNIFHDGSKPKIFEDTSGIEVENIIEKKLPVPVYKNSGFSEPASRIQQWHPFYAPYFPISNRDNVKVQVPTNWDAGDIAIESLGEYYFYKCIKTHAADKKRPGANPYFVLLTWDANGLRNDQPGWDSSSLQSYFPPDDFRLNENNYWKKMGMGYLEPDAESSVSRKAPFH